MHHRLGALAILLVLIGCAPAMDSPGRQLDTAAALSSETTPLVRSFEITQDVHYNYLNYLAELATNDGAFAVSVDGDWSGRIICPAVNNCHAEKNAINSCQWGSNTRKCLLFARGWTEKLHFSVVPVSVPLQQNDPIVAHQLTGAEIQRHLSGSSLRGRKLNGVEWTEFYAPGGEILGHDSTNGSYRGLYRIEGDLVCFTYFTGTDWCAGLSVVGEFVHYLRKGSRGVERVATMRDTRLLPGNALAGN